MSDIDARMAVMINAIRMVTTAFYRETGNRHGLLVALAGVSARIIMDYPSIEDREEAFGDFGKLFKAAVYMILEEQDDASRKG